MLAIHDNNATINQIFLNWLNKMQAQPAQLTVS